uniref:Peptidoglycan recognition protein LBi n=1 Tax=Sitophilus zeamais TaxID=7047 RepID=A0A411IZR2_SITZE|nr:peptidoglycan recognition protein LBi [Sitophilus zeamais]
MSSKQSRSIVPTCECKFEKMEEIGEKKVELNIVANSFVCTDPEIVTRDEWGAKPPTGVENLTLPVPYVVIHHSYIPAACSTKEECINDMQWMQNYHQQNNSWCDIGYNFAVGGDNRIYVGRGWTAVGAHAPRYNARSIGIVLIGDWTEILPPESQMLAAKQLINMGIRDGYISENYKLIGHRQVRETECPGEALYKEIQTWPHWIDNPSLDDEVIPVVPLDKEDLKPDPREDSGASLASEDNKIKRHSSTHKEESTSRSIKQ